MHPRYYDPNVSCAWLSYVEILSVHPQSEGAIQSAGQLPGICFVFVQLRALLDDAILGPDISSNEVQWHVHHVLFCSHGLLKTAHLKTKTQYSSPQ